MLPMILTFFGTAAFIAGVQELRRLKKMVKSTGKERSDPFHSSVSFLFSTVDRGPDFRHQQRLTILLFWASILLFFFARVSALSMPEAISNESQPQEANEWRFTRPVWIHHIAHRGEAVRKGPWRRLPACESARDTTGWKPIPRSNATSRIASEMAMRLNAV